MRKSFLLLLAVAIMLLVSSCAKRSTQWEDQDYLELSKVYPVVGDPLDVDFDQDFIYAALDQGGFGIIDKGSGSMRWLTRIEEATGGFKQLYKIRKIAAMREFNRLFITEVDGTDAIYILDMAVLDSLKYVDAVIGATQDISDMKFYKIANPTNSNRIEIAFTAGRSFQFSSYNTQLWLGYDYSIVPTVSSPGFDLTPSHVVLASQQRGLMIYNKSNQAFVGEVAVPGEAQKVKIVGNYAYVAGRQGGLSIVDISNPSAPRLMSSWNTTGYATNVDVKDNLAVVSSNSGGVYLFDITSPTTPVLLQRLTDCGYSNKARFDGNSIIVASRDNGIRVYNLK